MKSSRKRHKSQTSPPSDTQTESYHAKFADATASISEHSRKGQSVVTDKAKAEFKAKIQAATLAGIERAQSIHELKLDTTPEGIVAFGKLMIEKIGRNEIDLGRSQAVNAWIQTLIRVTESGVDALHEVEESTRILEETLRTPQPANRRATS